MTPIQAQKTLQRGHQACAHIADMFYSRGYTSQEYDDTSDQLVGAMDELYKNHELGLLSDLMRHVTRIMTPAPQCNRKPGITIETLVKHLVRFPIEPQVGAMFIMGDGELNSLLVQASLKSGSFSGHYDDDWESMFKKLAADGDVQGWKQLSEGVFFSSAWAKQRCDAITSVSCFDDEIISQHRQELNAHIQHLIDENEQPIKFGSAGRFEPTFDTAVRLYDTLKAIDHLPLAHNIMEHDYAESHSIYRMQEYQANYGWVPSDSVIRWLSRTRFGAGKDRLATSMTLHLLTLPALPEEVEFNEMSLAKLAEILNLDGQSFDFGTLKFTPSVVGQLVDRCVKASGVSEPFKALVNAGVSATHAQMSGAVRDSRMGADLGL